MAQESETPNLDYLREHVAKLKALLDDPHLGVFTWLEAYHRHMQALVDFYKQKEP